MVVAREDLLRWTGVALGVAGAVWVAGRGGLGLGPMLAPTLLGAGAVVGALAADATAPRPSGAVRMAGLTPRRVRDFVPRRAALALAGGTVLLVALLVAGSVTGSADDLGRAGRAYAQACGEVSVLRGPWPGSFYGLPLGGALALAGLGTVVALRRMARRPGVDDAWRRAGASRVLAAWGVLVTASLAGVSAAMSGALGDLPCASPGLDAASFALGAVSAASTIAAAVCGATLCRRG